MIYPIKLNSDLHKYIYVILFGNCERVDQFLWWIFHIDHIKLLKQNNSISLSKILPHLWYLTSNDTPNPPPPPPHPTPVFILFMKLQRLVRSQQTATSILTALEDGGDPSVPAGIKGYSAQNPEKWVCRQAAGIDWCCCSTWRREHSQGQGSECIYMTSLSRKVEGGTDREWRVFHQTVEWASKPPVHSFKHPSSIRKKYDEIWLMSTFKMPNL